MKRKRKKINLLRILLFQLRALKKSNHSKETQTEQEFYTEILIRKVGIINSIRDMKIASLKGRAN